jgi:diguanylate cyclase
VTMIALNMFYYLTACSLVAAVTWWLCYSHYTEKAKEGGDKKVRHAAQVLSRLQELSTNVAVEVDKHNSQVADINDKLHAAENQKPTVIIDVVAQLIEANQNMQKRLASTEDKLRKQAREIQIHAAEARTDALTLLANRRAFDDALIRTIAEYRRLGRTFSMIMVDVDHFKTYNDTHGHQAGDDLLQNVAKVLRRSMREMDLVARYGGEEFAIILPGTALNEACKAAMRTRQTIEKLRLRGDDSQDTSITMSFGVAEILKNEDEAGLVKRADTTLYAAKESGRNCVFRHDGANITRVETEKEQPRAQATAREQSLGPADEQKKREDGKASATGQSEAQASKTAGDTEPDLLGELPGRTNFCQQVRSRTAEWRRGGPTFSIVMLEVNRSEAGEDANDQLARANATLTAAKYLISTVRAMDVLGNYSPGCFVLLLPTAELVNALRVAERLREGVEQFSLSQSDGKSAITFSVGVVQVMESEESISLLKRAEAALDAADRRGGNRTYYHDGQKCAPITAMLETMDYLS